MNNYARQNAHFVAPYQEYKKAKKLTPKQELKELERDVARIGRPKELKEFERQLLSNPTSKNSYIFKSFNNPVSNDRVNFTGVEFTQYQKTKKEEIIHGVVELSGYANDGTIKVMRREDIYVYQPRFEGSKGFVLGPHYRNGLLKTNAAYFFKAPDNGQIYIGNIPKREITTGMQFDFDSRNEDNFKMTCDKLLDSTDLLTISKFITIKYDEASPGTIKSVDLSDKEAYKKLQDYLKKNSNSLKGESTLNTYLQHVKAQLEIAQKKDAEIEASVRRNEVAEDLREQQEATQTQSNEQSVADQNAKYINDLLKYGIRPSYGSAFNPNDQGPEVPPHPPHEHEHVHGPRR